MATLGNSLALAVLADKNSQRCWHPDSSEWAQSKQLSPEKQIIFPGYMQKKRPRTKEELAKCNVNVLEDGGMKSQSRNVAPL